MGLSLRKRKGVIEMIKFVEITKRKESFTKRSHLQERRISMNKRNWFYDLHVLRMNYGGRKDV